MNESHEGQATLLISNKEHLMIPEEITLRDWFAGQAMQAFITAVRGTGGSIHDKEISQSSFYIADAMMEARNNER